MHGLVCTDKDIFGTWDTLFSQKINTIRGSP